MLPSSTTQMKGLYMSTLANLNLKTLAKPAPTDPVTARRSKLLSAIEVQKMVLTAAQQGKVFTTPAKKEGREPRAVRAWFTAQDGGYYITCRYGARPLLLDGKSNAVFVAKLDEVGAVLTAFAAATKAGELDAAMAAVTTRKQG